MARLSTMLGMIAGAGMLMLAGSALAGEPSGGGGGCCKPTPPPVCCHKPPPPPPPKNPPCCTPGHNVNVPGVNVHVAQSVVVNASASAVAGSIAGAGSRGAVFVGGGGGYGGGYSPPMASGAIGGLNVEGRKRVAYDAKRSMFKKVVIRAICIDDKLVPHPASQVFAHQDVQDGYDGELYRCMAGTRLQYTWAEWMGKVSFDGGKSFDCRKGEALYYSGSRRGGRSGGSVSGEGWSASHEEGFSEETRVMGGTLECRPQKPARDCNERSLLRRFGAGIKVLTMYWTETYTAYREESESASASMGMSLDGGVGGTVY